MAIVGPVDGKVGSVDRSGTWDTGGAWITAGVVGPTRSTDARFAAIAIVVGSWLLTIGTRGDDRALVAAARVGGIYCVVSGTGGVGDRRIAIDTRGAQIRVVDPVISGTSGLCTRQTRVTAIGSTDTSVVQSTSGDGAQLTAVTQVAPVNLVVAGTGGNRTIAAFAGVRLVDRLVTKTSERSGSGITGQTSTVGQILAGRADHPVDTRLTGAVVDPDTGITTERGGIGPHGRTACVSTSSIIHKHHCFFALFFFLLS